MVVKRRSVDHYGDQKKMRHQLSILQGGGDPTELVLRRADF